MLGFVAFVSYVARIILVISTHLASIPSLHFGHHKAADNQCIQTTYVAPYFARSAATMSHITLVMHYVLLVSMIWIAGKRILDTEKHECRNGL